MNMENLGEKDKARLDYEIRIKKKGENFNLFIRELGITGKGKTLDEAYNNLLSKKDNLTREYEELDILDQMPEPLPRKVFKVMREPRGILDFLIKTLVVMGMVLLMLTISYRVLEQSFFNQARSLEATIEKVVYTAGRVVEELNLGLDKIRQITNKVGLAKGAIDWKELAATLDRRIQSAAARDISPEKKKELISNIRILVRRYKPILDEFAPLFSGDSSRLKN
jgi:hypothetical protein